MGPPSAPFQLKLKKKKVHYQKIFHIFSKNVFLVFQEIELSRAKNKKIIMFSQKNSFSYISGNGTF